MPVTETNRRKHDYAVNEIANSSLSAALKEDLTDVVSSSLEATNGLSSDEKLQSCTENQFNMARLLALFIVGQGRRVTSWKDVLMSFKWPIVIMFTVLCVALILKPELASLVESLAHAVRQ